MKPDPEHLVALTLAGVLSPEQTEAILASVKFTSSTMTELGLENTLNKVADACRTKRLAK